MILLHPLSETLFMESVTTWRFKEDLCLLLIRTSLCIWYFDKFLNTNGTIKLLQFLKPFVNFFYLSVFRVIQSLLSVLSQKALSKQRVGGNDCFVLKISFVLMIVIVFWDHSIGHKDTWISPLENQYDQLD